MRLVVDASVAVKWLVDEDGADLARGLLARGHQLHAPRLMASEVANALRNKVLRGLIQPYVAAVLASRTPMFPIEWAADEAVIAEATRIAVELDRSVYDCVYLALAHQLDATLVTADSRFVNAVAATTHGSVVALLSEVEPVS